METPFRLCLFSLSDYNTDLQEQNHWRSLKRKGRERLHEKWRFVPVVQCAKEADIQGLSPAAPLRLCHISVNQRFRCDSQREPLKRQDLWTTEGQAEPKPLCFRDDNKNASVKRAHRRSLTSANLASVTAKPNSHYYWANNVVWQTCHTECHLAFVYPEQRWALWE